ncbi:MAG TPA: hypothetical protein VKE69_01615, partial [Planctomycetota bacterium]|nr:hypothetical protein [Planctomycetota bacterium]
LAGERDAWLLVGTRLHEALGTDALVLRSRSRVVADGAIESDVTVAYPRQAGLGRSEDEVRDLLALGRFGDVTVVERRGVARAEVDAPASTDVAFDLFRLRVRVPVASGETHGARR